MRGDDAISLNRFLSSGYYFVCATLERKLSWADSCEIIVSFMSFSNIGFTDQIFFLNIANISIVIFMTFTWMILDRYQAFIYKREDVIIVIFSSPFCNITESATRLNNYYPLQRIARAPQPNTALLVPYPRVGKRSRFSDEVKSNERFYPRNHNERHLYVARIGKRALVHAARMRK
uniref:7TM_GPCR_Srx domain-containing protein n=1 Tax=Heterorhabditis bacteriophora TaxID=37862 RepID=A0A1I7WB72_HETBA